MKTTRAVLLTVIIASVALTGAVDGLNFGADPTPNPEYRGTRSPPIRDDL